MGGLTSSAYLETRLSAAAVADVEAVVRMAAATGKRLIGVSLCCNP